MNGRLVLVCVFISLTGLVGCINWIFNASSLNLLLPALHQIKFNSALLFMVSGLALCSFILNKRTAFQVASVFIFIIGFCSLLEDLTDTNLGVDEFFVKDNETGIWDPLRHGRMAIASSLCFCLLGAAFLMLPSRRKILLNASEYILMLVALISSIILMGHLFAVPLLYNWSLRSGMPSLSAILFFALSVSTSSRNKKTITSIFAGNRIGNIMIKRLLFPLIFSIVFAGFIIKQLYTNHFMDANFAITLCIIVFSMGTMFLIWVTSKKLNTIEFKRRNVERVVVSLNQELEEKVEQRTSQWKQAYNELRNQKELFFTLFHKGPVSKVLANLKTGILVDCSDAYLKLLQFSRDEIIGKTAVESGITNDSELRLSIISQIEDKGSAVIEDYPLKKKNGDFVWVSAHVAIIIINNVEHLLTTMIDVTERKKIENNYRYILQNATDIIYTTDRNGNFEFINESITNYIGFKPEDLRGKHYTTVVHDDFKHAANLFYYKQFKNETDNTYFELKVSTKDNQVKWIGQNVRIKRDASNHYDGFHAVARDITERKRLELDLQLKNERLEEAMQIAKFGYFEHDLIENKITRSSELFEIFETGEDGNLLDKESYVQFIVPEYLDEYKKHFERITVLKQQSSIEYQVKTYKGNLKYISTYARPIVDKWGNVIMIKGTTHDITARKGN